MRNMSLADIVQNTLAVARIEPQKRVKCLHHVPRGHRHEPETPRHIWHRFKIKGGITATSLIAQNITSNNSFLRTLQGRG